MRLDSIDCRKRMDSSMFGVLGTVDPDRGTHLVPVVFAVSGDELVVPIDAVKPKETISSAGSAICVRMRERRWSLTTGATIGPNCGGFGRTLGSLERRTTQTVGDPGWPTGTRSIASQARSVRFSCSRSGR